MKKLLIVLFSISILSAQAACMPCKMPASGMPATVLSLCF
jgi:hypothetical protein